jgi:hypothetical protein
MRSYVKVYLKLIQDPPFPGFRYYGSIGEVPGQQPDAVYAFKRLKKSQLIFWLNQSAFLYVTVWGGPDSVPPGVPFAAPLINQLTGFLPHIPYESHPTN